MNEREWVSKKRADWERLSALLDRIGRRGGVRSLSPQDLQEIGPLYRRVASDLAYARANAVSGDLALYLNSLVGRAYALLYATPPRTHPMRSMLRFYLVEFPALLQKHVGFFLAAVALSALGGLIGYGLVMQNPDNIDFFIPEQLKSSVEAWKSGDVSDQASAQFSAGLMVHNFQVGLVTAVSGIVLGLPSGISLFSNGGMLGAMTALMTQVKRHHTFWPGIVPHGVSEFTAIFICGAAGLLLGKALLLPGRLPRRDSLRLYGMDAIRLALGTIPLFIFAGVIEGMFSRLAIPAGFRYAFAAINGVLWYLYLFLPRREPADEPLR